MEGFGDFESDVASTDDHRTAGVPGGGLDGHGVVEALEGEHAVQVDPFDRWTIRVAPVA